MININLKTDMENIRLFTYNKGNFVYVELCSFICGGGVCTHAYECVGMGVYTKSEEDTGRLYHCPPYYLEAGSLTILEAHCLATLVSSWQVPVSSRKHRDHRHRQLCQDFHHEHRTH